ncbi:hypothetical protein A8C75_01425 [Marinobacterium aestuarii]|uniref:Uncharacterized protein n=1 Tax=Marinobacterium aestuarii TaxID=1821621 RepID=A0A1A9EUD2_9GAMM|nr:hypothetical protein A8C75_01425 [Marinobacterium aestuarii]
MIEHHFLFIVLVARQEHERAWGYAVYPDTGGIFFGEGFCQVLQCRLGAAIEPELPVGVVGVNIRDMDDTSGLCCVVQQWLERFVKVGGQAHVYPVEFVVKTAQVILVGGVLFEQ